MKTHDAPLINFSHKQHSQACMQKSGTQNFDASYCFSSTNTHPHRCVYANTHTSSARDLIKGCEIEHVPPSDSVKLDVTDLDCILTVTSDTSAGRMCGVLLLRARVYVERTIENVNMS